MGAGPAGHGSGRGTPDRLQRDGPNACAHRRPRDGRASSSLVTLLPTELVGSYALPSWLWIALERLEENGDLGEADLRETLDDAVNIAVMDQERAGLDVITDGEMRRRDFIQNFYGQLTGLRKLPPTTALRRRRIRPEPAVRSDRPRHRAQRARDRGRARLPALAHDQADQDLRPRPDDAHPAADARRRVRLHGRAPHRHRRDRQQRDAGARRRRRRLPPSRRAALCDQPRSRDRARHACSTRPAAESTHASGCTSASETSKAAPATGETTPSCSRPCSKPRPTSSTSSLPTASSARSTCSNNSETATASASA